ncbi:hypothetical protein B4U79_01720 [Dinothrombium tinctorium]|uniref:Uncharacterized protein n=1 Tax=Dinothrombium tinctorium TaxID=1965070 RepID=A0A3S3NSL3_9ACAR|nr:hypothetical protein B4U79_06684 [Dinothrombium tinctorium]RWS10372.1 hypothetical protein B4U79_01720 [Dinothrombium tinctorium]
MLSLLGSFIGATR